jgi:hypothetical protein
VTRALLALLLLCAVAGHAHADAAGTLMEAEARLYAGEHERVIELVTPLTTDATLPRADRAEAWRLMGIALFRLGRADLADAAFLEYLRLEPDAHLDPSFFDADTIAFFEGVRARHAGELRKLKPRPSRGNVMVNLLPPFGQFQNRQPAKAWALGVAEIALVATVATTYVVYDGMCDDQTGVCDDAETADTVRTVNIVAGGLLVATMVYGAVDGYLGWKSRGEAPAYGVGFAPTEGGATLLVRGSF